jgi:leucine-rich repeat protein SHOC2
VQLSTLDLTHNELIDLPETLGSLTHLQRLGLKYNQLSAVPKSLANCTNMEEFNVEGDDVRLIAGVRLCSFYFAS